MPSFHARLMALFCITIIISICWLLIYITNHSKPHLFAAALVSLDQPGTKAIWARLK